MGNEQSRRLSASEQMEHLDGGGAEDFECPVCLQVLERPVRTQCGHVFCQSCHRTNVRINHGKCPLCRGVTCHTETVATDVEEQIMSRKVKCRDCHIEVRLIHMRDHTKSCSKCLQDAGQLPETRPLPPARPATYGYNVQTHQDSYLLQPNSYREPIRSSVPHRATYSCPYCQERIYDEIGLVQHCLTRHCFNRQQMVCPICASMPWGDPSYRSRNFIGHLVKRHQFSYDNFVDYNQDEEVMLQSAILNSYCDSCGGTRYCGYVRACPDMSSLAHWANL